MPGNSHADPGESREEIIARYGKPDDSYANTSWRLEEGDLKSQERTILSFSAAGAPATVVLNRDGKCIEEAYGWTEDIGQTRVMEILLRYSKSRPWRITKLDYPDAEMVWRYTLPEIHLHAAYERRNTDDLNRIYYDLKITL